MNPLLRSPRESGRASERWENEGGSIGKRRRQNAKDSFDRTEDNMLTLLPPFEHKEPEDNDCGMPEHPIYADYSKYMWTSHKRSGGVEVKSVDDRTDAESK